jgi:sulfotransferase
MDKGIHFISGLPRSGSTLLSAILLQNPRFHAGVVSPMASFFKVLAHQMSQGSETSVFIDDEKRLSVLRGAFDSYYFREHPTKLVFDTHRFWSAKIAGLGELFPSSKMICCVREVPWILDSLERLAQRNALEPSRLYNFDSGGTVYSRFEAVRSGVGLVGFAWNATREAFFGGHADRLMLLQYESLVSDPEASMRAVYDFLGERWFKHDFDNVAINVVSELDSRLGAPGLHQIRARVAHEPRETVLPPDLWRLVESDSFWINPKANPYGIRIV